MKTLNIVFISIIALSIASCKGDKKKIEEAATNTVEKVEEVTKPVITPKKIKVVLESKSDSKLSGNVVFVENDGKVTMTALVSGLGAGEHAIHIHEKADCSSADGKSSGGHWNPTFTKHGKWGDVEGYHKGDIGNFETDANGNAIKTLTTSDWCIGCGDPKKDIVGKAIVVHQGIDDFTSQPSGAAGKRVGCGGVIEL